MVKRFWLVLSLTQSVDLETTGPTTIQPALQIFSIALDATSLSVHSPPHGFGRQRQTALFKVFTGVGEGHMLAIPKAQIGFGGVLHIKKTQGAGLH